MVKARRLGGLVVCAFALSMMSIGCQDKEAAMRPDPNAGLNQSQRAQKEIAEIQANTTMPEGAKQMAIAQIQAHAGGAMKAGK